MDIIKIEKEILKFWEKNKSYEKLRKMRKGKKIFFFLDGPPYVTGSPHPGIGWNRQMKDMIRRYKWMCGFDSWDQPGFDMHGLPIENGVEKKHGLKNKEDIAKFGVNKFIKECKEFAWEYYDDMIGVFRRLGEWANWEKPYRTLDNDYIESVWWGLKQCYDKGNLYLGDKALTWCPRCGTALAGNYEVVYNNIKDNSVYVKFPIESRKNEFLVIWTTTPWTLPENMAVMVHPDLDYVRIHVDSEIWILAKGLVAGVMANVGKRYRIVETFKGEKLNGLKYKQIFWDDVPHLDEIKSERSHTVVLSDKYVDLSAGSGLVHCAPGCGPEDLEVGKEHGIFPFNPLDENGVFSGEGGRFKGFVARKDDHKIVDLMRERGFLIHEVVVEHDYPHCERCKSAVVFKVTKQWFLDVKKYSQRMVKANDKVYWVPDWAGHSQFRNWLANVKDWCVTRQRFWGIPFPLWECKKCGNKQMIGSVKDIAKHGAVPKDLHKPYIDKVKWKCKCGGMFENHPDVIDVWIDASSAPYASLHYPVNKKLFEEIFPADFILESKDQIRGWFYGLLGMSMLVFGKSPFKAVHMYGHMTDKDGVSMSKRLGNYEPIENILKEFGADVFRFFCISTTSPGINVKFDKSGMKSTHNALSVLWNIQRFVSENMRLENYKHQELDFEKLDLDDKWILSRINNIVKTGTEAMERYEINELPKMLQEFFLNEFSRWYLKIKRDVMYSEEDKTSTLAVLDYVLNRILRLLAIVLPFLSEKMYQNMRNYLNLKTESVHHLEWPKHDEKLIDKRLEKDMGYVRDVTTAILNARDKAGLGLRWPVARVSVVGNSSLRKACKRLEELIKGQTNVKELELLNSHPVYVKMDVKVNVESVKSRLGDDAAIAIAEITKIGAVSLKNDLDQAGAIGLEIHGKNITLTHNDLFFKVKTPENVVASAITNGGVYLDKKTDEKLLAEGFSRELVRRIQDMRKEMGLKRHQKVKVKLQTKMEKELEPFVGDLEQRCGCELLFSKASGDLVKDFRIRNREFRIGLKK